jgi:hypothetical protein
LGYKRDLQLTVHPIGVDGKPSEVGFTIVVHVVSEYQSSGLMLGTQQQVLWGMETSCKTGLKTITAPEASGGTEFTFPFSVSTDGTSIVPEKVRSITLSGVEPNAPAGGSMTPGGLEHVAPSLVQNKMTRASHLWTNK